MALIHPKPTRNIYNKLKTTSLIKLLFLIILFMESATSKEPMRDELTLLNPGMNAKYYVKIPSELQELPVEARRTARTERFRKTVENLEMKFQKFHSLPYEQREALLDKYEHRIVNMGRNMRITRDGLDDLGFDITDETAQKIKYILTFYKGRDSSSCVLF